MAGSFDVVFCTPNLGDLSNLAKCKNAEGIVLDRCPKVTGDLSVFAGTGFKGVTEINLSMCEEITGDLKSLEGLNKITMLNIKNCKKITGALTLLLFDCIDSFSSFFVPVSY